MAQVNFSGYFFDTEEQAQSAISQIDQGEGYPAQDGLTHTYTDYSPFPGGGFYIISDEVVKRYLGEPAMLSIEVPGLDELP